MKLAAWCKAVGIRRATAYRWRAAGYLTTSIEINGQLFVTIDDDRMFWEKAKSGALNKELRGIAASQRKAA